VASLGPPTADIAAAGIAVGGSPSFLIFGDV
jgi:hypothetical protein